MGRWGKGSYRKVKSFLEREIGFQEHKRKFVMMFVHTDVRGLPTSFTDMNSPGQGTWGRFYCSLPSGSQSAPDRNLQSLISQKLLLLVQ